MIRPILLALICATLAGATTASAQQTSIAPRAAIEPGAAARASAAADALKVAEAEVAAAQARVDETSKKVDAGAAPQQELREARVTLEKAEANLSAARRGVDEEKRASALQRRVTVTFNGTPLRNAVKLLTTSGPLILRVDPQVPDAAITLKAQDVSLESVLDAIGEQAGVDVQADRLGYVLKQQPPLPLDPEYARTHPYTPERVTLLKSLERSVDVQMRDATVSQAAESLAKASGVGITVDPGVTMEKRVTAEAHGVPLRTVLEAIARQLGVMIAPAAESKGVILKPWPSFEVNGDRTVLAGPLAPWSADWGVVPDNSWVRVLTADRVRTFAPRPGTSLYTAPTIAGMPAWTSPGPGGVALTATGNMVVVAEPGAGPHGERGLWLTVYRLEGTNLEKVTSTFHPSAGAATAPARRGAAGAGGIRKYIGGVPGGAAENGSAPAAPVAAPAAPAAPKASPER